MIPAASSEATGGLSRRNGQSSCDRFFVVLYGIHSHIQLLFRAYNLKPTGVWLSPEKGNCMNDRKETVKVIHPHIRGFVNQTERWLEHQALHGFRLEEYHGWVFTFRRCQPYHALYFMYSAFNSSKEIRFDYHMAKIRYAKKNSVLNQTAYEIFELDSKKIDDDFAKYKHIRNNFYKRHYLGLLLFSVVAIVILLLCLRNPFVWGFLLAPILLLVYSLISLFGLAEATFHTPGKTKGKRAEHDHTGNRM